MHLTDDLRGKYGYFRDVNIMIFFGFGMLMTFLRRYGCCMHLAVEAYYILE